MRDFLQRRGGERYTGKRGAKVPWLLKRLKKLVTHSESKKINLPKKVSMRFELQVMTTWKNLISKKRGLHAVLESNVEK